MIRRLTTVDELAMAGRLRKAVASGETTIAADWLARSGARVVVQESGRHLEVDEAPLVAGAFADAGVERLLAIANDSLSVAPEAYELEAAADDLEQISDTFGGVNFVLVDTPPNHCIVFTAYDFKLIAGSPEFVECIAGEPWAAREAFLQFAADQPDSLRTTATRAATYMNWMADPE